MVHWYGCWITSLCFYYFYVSWWFSIVTLILTCCAEPFAERATAGEVAAVITPPATLSIVVPGFESCEGAGTDFSVPSDIFIRDACPPGAAWRNKMGWSNNVALGSRHNLFLTYTWPENYSISKKLLLIKTISSVCVPFQKILKFMTFLPLTLM